MIVSIRHSVLKRLFEEGKAAGVPRALQEYLLLWLSVIHAAKVPRDLSVAKVSVLEEDKDSYRLTVHGVGTFSFRFVKGEIRELNYRQHQK